MISIHSKEHHTHTRRTQANKYEATFPGIHVRQCDPSRTRPTEGHHLRLRRSSPDIHPIPRLRTSPFGRSLLRRGPSGNLLRILLPVVSDDTTAFFPHLRRTQGNVLRLRLCLRRRIRDGRPDPLPGRQLRLPHPRRGHGRHGRRRHARRRGVPRRAPKARVDADARPQHASSFGPHGWQRGIEDGWEGGDAGDRPGVRARSHPRDRRGGGTGRLGRGRVGRGDGDRRGGAHVRPHRVLLPEGEEGFRGGRAVRAGVR
mmetsp:Transcript_2621/g.5632  ORF Transcript_2621/g.5632 Transcript_2621/m.5632 type:complete len:258 (+) Transcript_2621:9-782(+)